MSEEKLRRCPFCGGEAEVWLSEVTDRAVIYCKVCDAQIMKPNEQEAIEAWNRRKRKRVVDVNKTITCFKCHGKGTYSAPILDDNGEWIDKWESCHCEVCGGTGKITLAFYEELQKGARDKE